MKHLNNGGIYWLMFMLEFLQIYSDFKGLSRHFEYCPFLTFDLPVKRFMWNWSTGILTRDLMQECTHRQFLWWLCGYCPLHVSATENEKCKFSGYTKLSLKPLGDSSGITDIHAIHNTRAMMGASWRTWENVLQKHSFRILKKLRLLTAFWVCQQEKGCRSCYDTIRLIYWKIYSKVWQFLC